LCVCSHGRVDLELSPGLGGRDGQGGFIFGVWEFTPISGQMGRSHDGMGDKPFYRALEKLTWSLGGTSILVGMLSSLKQLTGSPHWGWRVCFSCFVRRMMAVRIYLFPFIGDW